MGVSVRRASTLSPILSRLDQHPKDKVAIRHVPSGNEYSYGQLVNDITKWTGVLEPHAGSRIAIMGENSYQFVVSFYAAMSLPGTIAMPLCTNHTQAEIEYQLQNSEASVIVTQQRFEDKVAFSPLNKIVFEHANDTNDSANGHANSSSNSSSNETTPAGHMLYTSGTSGKPKGVLTPLDTFLDQAKALTAAWDINSSTTFLHTLPLHHVHGLLIAMTLPLLAGGRVEFLFPFSPKAWVDRITDSSLPPINTYTAVPTIYSRLVDYIGSLDQAQRETAKQALSNLRLAMCGSAALPAPLRANWESLSNVPLLERYGMTETGITLTQPLEPSKRVNGSVGSPAPGFTGRLVDENDKVIFQSDKQSGSGGAELLGEIQLAGPIFKEYWKRPDATKETFTEDGWFKTGDIARVDEHGFFHIQGRASMDIIKSGGEKISALEIEREMLGLDEIVECSVIGIPNEEWGEQVTAVVVLSPRAKDSFTASDLKTKLKGTLAGWKVPKRMIAVDSIPRNQMGKVNKKELVKQYSQ